MKVYKYRSAETLERDLKSLIKNEVYFSSFDKLNDPFEGRAIFKFKEFGLGNPFNQVARKQKKHVNKISERSLGDKIYQASEDFKKNTGVYSLSKTYSDELMWSYYSSSHQGICIEYNLSELLKNHPEGMAPLELVYSENIPVIGDKTFDVMNEDKLAYIKSLLFTKSKRWEHESELRIIKNGIGSYCYPAKALSGIYFGYRCSKSTIEFIKSGLEKTKVAYYQVEPKDSSYKLKRKRL